MKTPKKIELIAIEKLIPYAMNARTHSEEQVAQIAGSIREFGFTNPVLVDKDETIIAGVTHPVEKRKLTIEELKRICAFPDDFVLTGSYAQQWERLGRAVPPVMMSHIAATVRDQILRKIKK